MMSPDSIIYLVNRQSRCTGDNKYDLQCWTNFHDYELDKFKPISIEIDRFRDLLPVMNRQPNISYIGRLNKND